MRRRLAALLLSGCASGFCVAGCEVGGAMDAGLRIDDGVIRPDGGSLDGGFDGGLDGGSVDGGSVDGGSVDAGGTDARVLIDGGPFTGPLMLLNEVNATIASMCDLIELRVVLGGDFGGYVVEERGTALITFPTGLTLATNDVVVIHLDRADLSCRGGGAAPADEVASPTEQPASSVSSNFDGAYDFYSTDTGLTPTNNVLVVRDGTGRIVDAVLLVDTPDPPSAPYTTLDAVNGAAAEVASAGQWQLVGGGVPPVGFSNETFRANAVVDLDGTGTDRAGESIQRNDDDDNNDKDDWTQAPSSWGAINAGQSTL
jgi:hypothetical protein